ncbi:unnamed protein product [Ectocarpus sp. 6 AP-2014]
MAWSLRAPHPSVTCGARRPFERRTMPRPTFDKRTSSRQDCFDDE